MSREKGSVEMINRIFTVLVCVSFALFCASFSVFAEEITSYFQFDSMTLVRFVILNEDGTIRDVEDKNITGISNYDGFLFPYAVSGAYWPSIPGDLVCAHVSFDGNFDWSFRSWSSWSCS